MIDETILEKIFAPGVSNSDFDTLYRQIFRFAHRMILDVEGAKDIASESMMKIWTHGQAFENVKHLQVFALTVTKNHCIDFLRKKKQKQKADIYFFRNGKKSENVIEGRFDKNQLVILTCEKIECLPERMKEVIKLKYLEGLSRKEISEKLNLSENTVRNTNATAIKALRIAMASIVDVASIQRYKTF
jgi:RNA polymerase sigma-70 factor (ECF subfamily)